MFDSWPIGNRWTIVEVEQDVEIALFGEKVACERTAGLNENKESPRPPRAFPVNFQVDTVFECVLRSSEILGRVEREGWVEATPSCHLTVQVAHRVSARRTEVSQELPDVDAGRRVPPLR